MYKIVIIGGGVSGLSLGITLASGFLKNKINHKILIIDNHRSDALKARFFNAPGIEFGATGEHILDKMKEQFLKYKTGDIITEDGFTSTSMIKGGANFSDLPVSIEIINSKSGKDISGFSDEKDEQEVLFDKGAKFKVISKKDSNGKTIIYLEEV